MVDDNVGIFVGYNYFVADPGLGDGPYALRVRLTAGARVPVHRHPDDRVVTVLAGTVHAGFGGIFDETRTVAMQTGTVFLVPADESHYLWARDGDAEYQENGVGPTGQSRGW